MLKSMTGFGRSEFVDENYDLTFEIKTVNNKFLDIQIKSPYFLNFCDDIIKNEIRKKLSRGRVDVFIKGRQKFDSNTASLEVNYDLAKAYFDAYKNISNKLGLDGSISLGNIIKNDYIVDLKASEIDEDYLKENIIIAINNALLELINMRKNEGENLEKDLEDNILSIERNLKNIKASSKDVLNNQIEKLKQKLENFSKELTETEINRLNLEIIFYTDKLDINEEITRLNSHIDNFKKFIKSETQIGKKMDFLLQEMNREINTIANKSNSFLISNYVIEMKVSLEKLREQVQNIE